MGSKHTFYEMLACLAYELKGGGTAPSKYVDFFGVGTAHIFDDSLDHLYWLLF